MNNVYIAWANDDNGRRCLGHYEGNMHDVEALVKSTKNVGYGLTLELIKPIKVPEGIAAKIKKLKEEQKQLEQRLAEIKQEIGGV